MKKFTLVNATTVDEAASALAASGTAVLAGGTDLLVRLKDHVSPTLPDALVNIKTIPGLDYIKEEAGVLKIGALTKLTSIYKSSLVQGKYGSLAEAAHKVGVPELRNMGTIGGNLCQEVWCWYYRLPMNQFFCLRKGGTVCQAIPGLNRYLAILGWSTCPAVCPSDTAIPLTALKANIITNKGTIPIGELFKELENDLDADEIITEVQVPEPASGTKQSFQRFAYRKAFDFAISSVAAAITSEAGNVTDASIVLGGVAPTPYRAADAEDALMGKAITESSAEEAGAAAVKDAEALSENAYKIQITKTLVKRAVLACK